jgi:hypothetical protein
MAVNFTFSPSTVKEKVGTAGRHPQDWAFVTLHHV